MKTKFIFLFLLLNLLSIPVSFSQITIGKIVKQKKDTIVERPIPYDSIRNFEFPENPINYKQYVGLQVYLPKNNEEFLPSLFFKTRDLQKTENLIDKYYTIIDVFFPDIKVQEGNYNGSNKYSDSLYNYLANLFLNKFIYSNKYTKESTPSKPNPEYPFIDVPGSVGGDRWTSNGGVKWIPNLIFMLRCDHTKDTLLWVCSIPRYSEEVYNDYFVLVPYFVKQKQLYQNKTLVFMNGHSNIDQLKWKDVITDKEVIINPNSKWDCSEVTLLKLGAVDGSIGITYDTSAYRLNYVLKNMSGGTIALTNLSLFNSRYYEFITQKEYDKIIFERKFKKEELIAKQKQEKLQEAQNEKLAQDKYKMVCINKFGAYYGDLIAQGKVKIGMTTAMCKAAWGTPYNTFKTTDATGEYEDWYYGWKYSLSFKDAILIEINN